jgi:hypothetical protein
MNPEDFVSLALIGGLALLAVVSVDPIPGDELGLILLVAIGAIVLIDNSGGSLNIGPASISA